MLEAVVSVRDMNKYFSFEWLHVIMLGGLIGPLIYGIVSRFVLKITLVLL